MAITFGIFTLGNPDSHFKSDEIPNYGIPVDAFCWSSTDEFAADASNYDIVMSVLPPFYQDLYTENVTRGFLIWFELGFVLQSISLGAAMVLTFMGPESPNSLKWGAITCGFINCV